MARRRVVPTTEVDGLGQLLSELVSALNETRAKVGLPPVKVVTTPAVSIDAVDEEGA